LGERLFCPVIERRPVGRIDGMAWERGMLSSHLTAGHLAQGLNYDWETLLEIVQA